MFFKPGIVCEVVNSLQRWWFADNSELQSRKRHKADNRIAREIEGGFNREGYDYPDI